jgi:hypothetical protein
MSHQPLTSEMRRCIDECTSCHDICAEAVVHCLTLGGSHAEPAHIRELLDCAQICQTTADFMLRGSDRHPDVCAVCAEVCEACARSCEALADDDMMRRCAEECRRCADSCRSMSSLRTAQ